MTDIEEGNKLIAEFMYLKFSQKYERYDNYYGGWFNEDDGIWYDFLTEKSEDWEGYKKIDGFIPNNYHYILKYQSSWDWLMPAWRKVIDVIGVNLYCGSDKSAKLWLEKSKEIEMDIITVDIDGAFNKIANLIKFYNSWKEK